MFGKNWADLLAAFGGERRELQVALLTQNANMVISSISYYEHLNQEFWRDFS